VDIANREDLLMNLTIPVLLLVDESTSRVSSVTLALKAVICIQTVLLQSGSAQSRRRKTSIVGRRVGNAEGPPAIRAANSHD
jgi:hypothetical protein